MIRILSPRALAIGFLAGALAVPLFRQAMVLVLHLAGQVPNVPWSLQPIPPFKVPALLNEMFWAGAWCALFAIVVEAMPGRIRVNGPPRH